MFPNLLFPFLIVTFLGLILTVGFVKITKKPPITKKWVRPEFLDQTQANESIEVAPNESQKVKLSSDEDQISSIKHENMSPEDS